MTGEFADDLWPIQWGSRTATPRGISAEGIASSVQWTGGCSGSSRGACNSDSSERQLPLSGVKTQRESSGWSLIICTVI